MNIPEGYRKLLPGETLKETDLYWSTSEKWEKNPYSGGCVTEVGIWIRQKQTRKWNVLHDDDEQYYICKGNHASGIPCEYLEATKEDLLLLMLEGLHEKMDHPYR